MRLIISLRNLKIKIYKSLNIITLLRYMKIIDYRNQEIFCKKELTDEDIFYNRDVKNLKLTYDIKDLREELNPPLNKKAIDIYLSLGYIPAPLTVYEGIYRIPAFSELRAYNGSFLIQKKPFSILNRKFTEEKLKVEIKESFLKSIKEEINGEKKVGLLLSGGIDSSTVLAFLSQFNIPIHTYTVGFHKQDPDLLAARKLSNIFSTKHNEILVNHIPIKIFNDFIKNLNQPVSDMAYLSVRIILENIDREINKVFCGTGGDEVFGGYETLIKVDQAKYIKFFPKIIQKFVPWIIQPKNQESRQAIRNFLKYYNNYSKSFHYISSFFNFKEKHKLYNKNMRDLSIDQGEIFNFNDKIRYSQNLMSYFLEKQLQARLIGKYAKDYSFKYCFPFLTNELISLMINVPVKYKYNIFLEKDKIILRKILKELVPISIAKRAKKGFNVPFDYLLKGDLGEEIKRILSNKENINRLGMFKFEFIENLLQNFKSKSIGGIKIWTLFVLIKWIELNFKDITYMKAN